MTEVERIISEGIIPVDFLKPEVRCEFFVDVDRKKLWMVSLDMLIKFDAICKKHNLKYFLVGGSCLGAVRHHGFIPWDDDVDVGMLREDYDKFTKIAKDEFKEPYFWQTPKTDKGFLYSCNKLRNSRTSAIVETFRFSGFNQGIWLSVFPYENCVLDGVEERYNKIKLLNQENSAHMRRSNPHPTEADIKRLAQFPYRDPMVVMNELQSIATQFNGQDTEYIQLAVCTIYPCKNLIYRKSYFESVIFMNFEGLLQVLVMAGYDEYLKTAYGDYMSFPPIEQRGKWHDGIIFNADKPYSEYVFD